MNDDPKVPCWHCHQGVRRKAAAEMLCERCEVWQTCEGLVMHGPVKTLDVYPHDWQVRYRGTDGQYQHDLTEGFGTLGEKGQRAATACLDGFSRCLPMRYAEALMKALEEKAA